MSDGQVSTTPTPKQAPFRLLNSEVKPLTPEFAREFQELEPSPTERVLDQSRIKILREKAENGRLVTFHWSIARHGNRRLRMNGQHSSAMLCALNGLFPSGLFVHLDEYEVEGPEALAVLFRQFDDRKSGRSPSDVSGAYQGLYNPLKDVRREQAKLAVDGIAWYRQKIEGVPVQPGDGKYALFGETQLHPFICWIGDLLSSKTREMHRIQVISAIFACFQANESEARTFWAKVARGGQEYEDIAPATVLDNWLKSLFEGDKKRKIEIKPAEYYQGCIYAWNAHREGKTLTKILWDTKKGWNEPHG